MGKIDIAALERAHAGSEETRCAPSMRTATHSETPVNASTAVAFDLLSPLRAPTASRDRPAGRVRHHRQKRAAAVAG
jgi:hypothetical protein